MDKQAILARDMIDMILEYVDEANVLEYLDSFAFTLARIFEGKTEIDWDAIASICDQRYYSLNKGEPIPLDRDKLMSIRASATKYIS